MFFIVHCISGFSAFCDCKENCPKALFSYYDGHRFYLKTVLSLVINMLFIDYIQRTKLFFSRCRIHRDE